MIITTYMALNIYIYYILHTIREIVGSRITLTSPDPSTAASMKSTEETTVYSESDSVTFEPNNMVKEKRVEGTVETVQLLDDNENVDSKRDEL